MSKNEFTIFFTRILKDYIIFFEKNLDIAPKNEYICIHKFGICVESEIKRPAVAKFLVMKPFAEVSEATSQGYRAELISSFRGTLVSAKGDA